jgi:hypothetical protein
MQRLAPKHKVISFLIKGIIMGIRKFVVSVFLTLPLLVNTQALAFTQVIVFGDSLSDDGNIAHRARDLVGFSYPSSNFNYSDYRFTDDTNTAPAANSYWHLARATGQDIFELGNSLDGGTDYLAAPLPRTRHGSVPSSIIRSPSAEAISPSPSTTWASKLRLLSQSHPRCQYALHPVGWW